MVTKIIDFDIVNWCCFRYTSNLNINVVKQKKRLENLKYYVTLIRTIVVNV